MTCTLLAFDKVANGKTHGCLYEGEFGAMDLTCDYTAARRYSDEYARRRCDAAS